MSLYLGKEKVGASFMGTGNPVAEDNDVIFIDYDGTIRYSYAADEFLALTELPPNPHHAGLTSQGWNWTLENAQDYASKNKYIVIGQNYVTNDNKTRIYFELPFDWLLSPVIRLYYTNNTIVDWGDNTPTETLNGSYGIAGVTHTYSKPGNYIITFDGPVTFACQDSRYLSIDSTYVGFAKKIELGSNAKSGIGLFYGVRGLESITVPKSFSFGQDALYKARIKGLVIPNGQTCAVTECHSCECLEYISYPITCKASVGEGFAGCFSLKRINETGAWDSYAYRNFQTALYLGLQSVVLVDRTKFGDFMFSGQNLLHTLSVPASVTSIQSAAINTLNSLKELIFIGNAPPQASSSNVFSIPARCVICVPFSALAAYLTATNYPAPVTYTYIGFATYEDGETLPAQDSTEAYNVVWYASKADAVNEQNPITVGNGKEIYCRYTEVSE